MSGYWAVTEKGIYFVEFALDAPRGVGRQVDLYSYPSRQTKPVAPLGKAVGSAAPAFSATRDGRSLLWTQVDQTGSDLMIVENFR